MSLQVIGMNTVGVEAPLIVLHVLVRMAYGPLQPIELYGSKLIDTGALERLRICAHVDSPVSKERAPRVRRWHNSKQLPGADNRTSSKPGSEGWPARRAIDRQWRDRA